MIGRLLDRLRASARKPAASPPVAAPTLDAAAAKVGTSASEWLRRRRETRLLYSSPAPDAVAALEQRHAARAEATVRAAERLLRHEFELLGSGPYVPTDPDRPERDGYRPIDWTLDPVRALRFPRGFSHKQWNMWEMKPAGADVKFPWELGRCQHWATLGQAYQLSGHDRFAMEIARELEDFVEANPVGSGMNWSCTMDVGIRAANWATGLELVHGSRALDDRFWLSAYRALYDHGVFVRNNLENFYEVTSNHFLSNLLGLVFLGRVFGDLREGAEWSAFSRAGVEQEIKVQVLDDGADYESSVPYHRLVTELFLSAARLSDAAGEPLSQAYRTRLRRMVAFLATVTRPDGLMPQVGDADDGRLHVFEGFATTSPQDARHLFGPAGIMFDQPDWRALGGEAGDWEAVWWGLDGQPPSSGVALPSVSTLFPDAGIAVVRDTGHYLLVTNGSVGTGGFGNHKHNDLLSFEYHHAGTPLIVDPGSFVYTANVEARNRFRGTGWHSTLMIDRVEQNDLRPVALYLFRLFDTSRAETVSFREDAEVVEYVGRHHGYERLLDPVTHQRTFRFHRASGGLVIVDQVSGSGRHELGWHFHLAPGIAAESHQDHRVALAASGGRRWMLEVPHDLEIAIGPADYSPSYGVKVPCLAIDVTAEVALSGRHEWQFTITP